MEKPGKTPEVDITKGYLAERFEWVRVKDESKNPTGTFKDRRSAMIVDKAREANVQKLVLISAGNAAYSLSAYAEGSGIEVVPIIDSALPNEVRSTVRGFAPKMIEVDLSERVLTSEDLIAMARQNADERIWEVSNGFHTAYQEIVRELTEEPDVIVIPCGSGEGMIGVYEGIKERGWQTKVRGITSKYMDKLRTIHTPYREQLDAIGKEGHTISQYHILVEASLVEKAPPEIRSEPAATLAFGELLQLWMDRIRRVIIVNSGRGKLLDLLSRHQPWPTCGIDDPIQERKNLDRK